MGAKINPAMKNCIESRFSITVLRVGSAAGVNVPVIFMAEGTKLHPRLKATNLVTRYGFPEGSYAITNKAEYMYDDIWAKVVKVVDPGIRKMKISNFACIFPILFSIYISLRLCTSKLSSNCL